ncbi:hypothetical protein BGX31_008005 [Mortierella sp. GBA43]|nr:hypothetical protein BGX31_008005 [Mortierella sp. GBA43]
MVSSVARHTTESSQPRSTAEDSFYIPKYVQKDDPIDYWKLYQNQLNRGGPISDTTRLRLCQWLINRGMTKESAPKLTKLMGELQKRSVPIEPDYYNELIHFYIKCTKYQDAQSILDSFQEKSRSLAVGQRMLALQLALYLKSENEAGLQELMETRKNAFMQFMDQFVRWTKGLKLTNDHFNRVKAMFYDLQNSTCPPSSAMFITLLESLFDKNHPREALALVNHTLDIGYTANNEITTTTMLGLLKAGLYQEAAQVGIRTIGPESKLDLTVVNSILTRLCQNPTRFNAAKEIWDHMLQDKEFKPDTVSFSNMLNGYMRDSDPESALKLWDEMLRKPYLIKPNTVLYNSLLNGLFYNHQPEKAKAFYEEMAVREDITVPLDTYHIMIKGLLSVRDEETLAKVLQRMEQDAIEPNEMTFSIIADIIFSQRDAGSALKVAELMEARGIPKTAITYSCKIAGLANVGDMKSAQQTFQEMEQAGHEPSIHSYGAIMQGALKKGDTELAEQFAARAKSRIQWGLSKAAYQIMIAGYAELLMTEKAEEWLYELQRRMMAKNMPIPWKAYFPLLRICVIHERWAAAQRVVESMKETGFRLQVPRLIELVRKVEDHTSKTRLSPPPRL